MQVLVLLLENVLLALLQALIDQSRRDSLVVQELSEHSKACFSLTLLLPVRFVCNSCSYEEVSESVECIVVANLWEVIPDDGVFLAELDEALVMVIGQLISQERPVLVEDIL